MSLIPPSLVILPLVLIIVYLLNQRHERKIKDSFDQLIEPVKQDNLFDLPKANNPIGPTSHEPYIPPANGQAKLKDDLSKNKRLNAVIEQAEGQLKRPVKAMPIANKISKAQISAEKTSKAEKLARVKKLQAELARVQAKKRRSKQQQTTEQMQTKNTRKNGEQAQLNFSQSYQALKPTMNVRVKK